MIRFERIKLSGSMAIFVLAILTPFLWFYAWGLVWTGPSTPLNQWIVNIGMFYPFVISLLLLGLIFIGKHWIRIIALMLFLLCSPFACLTAAIIFQNSNR
jgi:hypothetical protein